ncbi:thioester domain-containing protein [Bacillus gobiensis]|uniref:thioester domain-containing protein n=1 Tax=Bacillus gobiensis TaxID=1441095 RepID=UPI003D25107F
MKKKLRFPLITLICVFVLQNFLFSFDNQSNVAHAASPKVEYLGKVSYSYYTVGKFKVNGEYAFCVDHALPTPSTGSPYKGGSVYNNESIRAILYYGYGGDGNVVGNSNAAYVATSMALDSVMHGNHSSGRSTIPGYDTLMNHAAKKDAPSTSASFSKTKARTNVSGNEQKSETIKFNADSRNSVKLRVPSGVKLHLGSSTFTNRTVTIKGGQSFYLTAGLDYGKDVTFSNVKPSLGPYQTILFLSSNGSYQRLSQGLVRDPEPMKTLAVDFQVRQKKITVQHIDKYTNKLLDSDSYTRNIGSSYNISPKSSITNGGNKYLPVDKSKSGKLGNNDITLKFYYKLERTITVNHIDARDNRLITSKSYKVLRGDKYSFGPRTDLKKGSYTYRPISTAKKAGTVGTSNITLDFYYDTPLIKTGLDKIQVYTAPTDEGLPVKVNLSKVNNYPESIRDMADAKVNVSLYQGNKRIATNAYTAKTLPKNIDFKVPSSYLAVNQKNPYTVKIEGFSKDEIDVISNAATITTDGYTSSERSFDVSNTSMSFTGVIMTEREIGKNMVVYNEGLKVNVDKIERKLTGYGFEYPIDVVYTNDLGQRFTSKLDFYVPKSLVDTYLTYPVSDNRSKIRFDETDHTERKSRNVLTTTKRFELPEVNIEKRTGNLFSNTQVAARDSRIKFDVIDGGRKFYTPIWGDLGIYQLEMKNVDPLGVHKINLSMKQNLEIYAYMYGHMDSKTGKEDAIYLRPINADDPNYPDKWSAEDIARFKEWNKN